MSGLYFGNLVTIILNDVRKNTEITNEGTEKVIALKK